ncbi:MAG: hypothetical protein WAW41_05535 [Methylobacter sp.]
MKQYTITLTLQEDVIISQRSASLGGHRSLDYVPGAVLLGACAGRLYNRICAEFGQQQAYRLFHSGKVRFGNAYPLSVSGQLGMPMPLLWRCIKGDNYQSKRDGDRYQLDIGKINQDKDNGGVQYVQLRSGYLTCDLEILKPGQTLRMKTAIDPDTARAATSQLFGYQALQAGQRFCAILAADDDVLELAELAAKAMRGKLLLGRSRSAQYGKAVCEVSESFNPPAPDAGMLGIKQLKLWLQADTVLQDDQGRPLMHGEHVSLPGLPDSEIDWQDSVLRFRRYSPYNGKRRSFDMERQAIEKGSVLSVTLHEPLDQAQWDVLQKGLGLYRESGLGQVVVNHALTDNDKIKQIIPFADVAVAAAQVPKQPASDFAKWIQARVAVNTDLNNDKKYAEQLISELPQLYQRARAYYGLEAHMSIGPSASQWSQVVDAGKEYQHDQKALFGKVFDADNGICKVGDEAWSVTTLTENGTEIKFADWLKQALENTALNSPAYVATLVARMGAEYVKAEKKGVRDDA